jgi:hypothetical protein
MTSSFQPTVKIIIGDIPPMIVRRALRLSASCKNNMLIQPVTRDAQFDVNVARGLLRLQ